jgi:hypothetical protein
MAEPVIIQSTFGPDDWLEYIGVLVGMAMGILYGFGGFRAPRAGAIWNTPRVKDLRWMLGVAFASFIADFKAVHPAEHPDLKSHVFLFYVGGFFATAFLTILSMAVYIYADSKKLERQYPYDYPPVGFAPVPDYLTYGYSLYRTALNEARETLKNEERSEYTYFKRDFIPLYLHMVDVAILEINYYVGDQKARRNEAIHAILATMSSVVLAYRRPRKDALSIDVSYMIAYDKSRFDRRFLEHMKFRWGHLDRYGHFLALKRFGEPITVDTFVLPVEPRDPKRIKMVLPGAPDAYYRKETRIVADVLKDIKSERGGIPPDIVEELKVYFKQKSVRSIASLNIIGRHEKQLGIVNVTSDQPEVFGKTQAEKDDLKSLLRPLVGLLGFLIQE